MKIVARDSYTVADDEHPAYSIDRYPSQATMDYHFTGGIVHRWFVVDPLSMNYLVRIYVGEHTNTSQTNKIIYTCVMTVNRTVDKGIPADDPELPGSIMHCTGTRNLYQGKLPVTDLAGVAKISYDVVSRMIFALITILAARHECMLAPLRSTDTHLAFFDRGCYSDINMNNVNNFIKCYASGKVTRENFASLITLIQQLNIDPPQNYPYEIFETRYPHNLLVSINATAKDRISIYGPIAPWFISNSFSLDLRDLNSACVQRYIQTAGKMSAWQMLNIAAHLTMELKMSLL